MDNKRARRTTRGTASPRTPLLPRRETGRDATLPGFGGVFEKGSLAKERDSSTFLSHLVRTSLACSVAMVPHLKAQTHQKGRTGDHGRARSALSPQGWGVLGRTLSCWRRGGPGLPAEGNLASLLNLLRCSGAPGYVVLFSVPAATGQASQSPTSPPNPSTRQRPRVKAGPARGHTSQPPQPISNSSSSLFISFPQFPRKSALLTHSRSHTPNPPQLVRKRVFAVLKVWPRETSPLAAR